MLSRAGELTAVLCVTDDVSLAAAVAVALHDVAAVRVMGSAESVFAVTPSAATVVLGADAAALSAVPGDAVVAVVADGAVVTEAAGAATARAATAMFTLPLQAQPLRDFVTLTATRRYPAGSQSAAGGFLARGVPGFEPGVGAGVSGESDSAVAAPSEPDVGSPSQSGAAHSAGRTAGRAGNPVTTYPEVRVVPQPRGHEGPRVITVCNASGGAGASSLAWVVALAQQGDAVLVDGDARSPGLDLFIRAESEPASRWPDVAGLDEPVALEHIRRSLVNVTESCVLLSHGRSPASPQWSALAHVLDAVSPHGTVVIDLSADTGSDFAAGAIRASTHFIVVMPATVAACAGARTLLHRVPRASGPTTIAIRGNRAELTSGTVHEVLGADNLVRLPEDSGLGRRLHDRRFNAVVGTAWQVALQSLDLGIGHQPEDGRRRRRYATLARPWR